MQDRAKQFVWLVCALALMATGAVFVVAPTATAEQQTAIFIICFLAVIAETLTYLLPNSAVSSIAFIAYLSGVLLSPSFAAVLAFAAVRTTIELLQQRPLLKRVYNIAHYLANSSIAVLAFIACGGESLLSVAGHSILEATRAEGLAAMGAFAASIASSSALLVGVLAASSGKRPAEVFRETKLPTLGIDILAAPIVFVFAWVYTAFGAIVAVALWVPILGFRQLNKANLDLEQMNRELLQLMVKSIEARDPYTSGHSRRVQEYAVIIARGAKLGERDVERISQAALLHDVGKINDKYHPILTKPDRLTNEEWTIMKEHPVDGANLVGTMTRLRHLIPAIRHHHENWDGTGYPDRIAGDLIPLDARVIALADTIDAMSSARPYRPGLTPEQVRAEIVRCRGRQFDPQLADRVLSSEVWNRLFPEQSCEETVGGGLKLVRADRVAV
jgi:putative nucleotidyltransferase with HDIG domain